MTDVVDAPRIDPRFARRRIEVIREQGRRRLRLAVVALVILACAGLAVGTAYSPLMEVRHVRVTPDAALDPSQLEAATGLYAHPLMIHVDVSALQQRLDALPGVGDAHVVRRWPSTVSISFTVRHPIAVVARPSGGWAEVDPTGRVLRDVAAQPVEIPVLQGVGSPPAPGSWLPGSLGAAVAPGEAPSAEVSMAAASDSPAVPRGAEAALVALQALPAGIRHEVVSVSSGPDGDLTMVVIPTDVAVGSIEVDFGDGSELAAKLTSLSTLLSQANLSGIVSIDLSVPDRPAAVTASASGPQP